MESIMIRTFLTDGRRVVVRAAVATAVLALMGSAAYAKPHDIGYHTKGQIKTICENAGGTNTAGAEGTTWGCNAKDWWIGCKDSGQTCVISGWRKALRGDETVGGLSNSSGGVGDGTGVGGNTGGGGGHYVDHSSNRATTSGSSTTMGNGRGGIVTGGGHDGGGGGILQ